MNMKEIINKDERLISLKDLINISLKDKKYEDMSNAVLENIKGILEGKYIINVNHEYEELLYEMCRCFFHPYKIKKAIVLPIEPGIGKSTFVEVFLKYMVSVDPSFGCIIIKERKNDVKKLADILDGQAYPLYGFDDDCLEGKKVYSKRECILCKNSDCRIKKNYNNQKKYPIIIMTSERFKIHIQNERNMDSLLKWYNLNNKLEYERTMLIIDEKPYMAINESITLDSILTMKSRIMDLSDSDSYLEDLQILSAYIDEIIKNTINSCSKNNISRNLESLNSNYTIPTYLKTKLLNKLKYDNADIIYRLEGFINKGGVIKKCNGYKKDTWVLTSKEYIDYSNMNFEKVIILDGTAKYDPEYKKEYFNILDLKEIRRYENLQINICSNLNVSKKSIKKQDKVYLNNIVETIKTISEDSETLVLTYKEMEEVLKSIIDSNSIDCENIYIDHFGNIKGSNMYQDCKRIIFIGLLNKGDDYYAAKAMSINNKQYEELTAVVNNKDYELKYEEQEIQDILNRDQFVDIIQSILRTKIRNSSTDKVEVYIAIRNPEVKRMLNEYFTGCTMQEWIPGNNIIGASRVKNKEAKYIADNIRSIFSKTDKVSQKELRELFGIKYQQKFRSMMNNPIVASTLDAEGITKQGKNYVKVI